MEEIMEFQFITELGNQQNDDEKENWCQDIY